MYETVLLQVVEDLKNQVLSHLRKKPVTKANIQNMLKALDPFYQSGKVLCFITIFSIGESSPLIKKILSKAINYWIQELETTLKQIKHKEAKLTAQNIVASIQGGLVLSHATGDLSLFKNCLKNCYNSIK